MSARWPTWNGVVSAFAWVVLTAGLTWTALNGLAAILRFGTGAGGFFSAFAGRSAGEALGLIAFAAVPAAFVLFCALAACGATNRRMPRLKAAAVWNLGASLTLATLF